MIITFRGAQIRAVGADAGRESRISSIAELAFMTSAITGRVMFSRGRTD